MKIFAIFNDVMSSRQQQWPRTQPTLSFIPLVIYKIYVVTERGGSAAAQCHSVIHQIIEAVQAGDPIVSAIKEGPFQLQGGLVVLKGDVVKCILYSVVKKGWICSTKNGPSSIEAGEPGGASPVKMIGIQDHGSPRCGCKASRLLDSMRLPLTLTPLWWITRIFPRLNQQRCIWNHTLCTCAVKSRMTETDVDGSPVLQVRRASTSDHPNLLSFFNGWNAGINTNTHQTLPANVHGPEKDPPPSFGLCCTFGARWTIMIRHLKNDGL